LEEWLNCTSCSTRYKAFLSNCPNCGETNRYHHHEISDRKSSRKVALIGISVVAVIAIVVILFIPISQIRAFFPLGNDSEDNNVPSIDSEADDEPRTEMPPANPPSDPIVHPTPPDIDLDELALRVHELINEEREKHDLAVLDWDSRLARIAELHSDDMAEREYFDHVNPDGEDPSDRAERRGYDCFKIQGAYYTIGIGENIMQGWLYDSVYYVGGAPIYQWITEEEIAELTVSGWMDSEGHRKNILTESYDKEGIGVASTSDYKLYITENFC
jgi:uncharacterized protein YkwD